MKLRSLLDLYYNIECPAEGVDCVPNKCEFAYPSGWVEYHGYTCWRELLYYFEYEDEIVLKLKEKKYVDMMNQKWARRKGNYGG